MTIEGGLKIAEALPFFLSLDEKGRGELERGRDGSLLALLPVRSVASLDSRNAFPFPSFSLRLSCSLMMHGRNNGKKLMANRMIKHTFDIIHLLTDQNPIQVQ